MLPTMALPLERGGRKQRPAPSRPRPQAPRRPLAAAAALADDALAFAEGAVKYSVFSGVLPELTPEQVVETVARHGYDGIEWRVDGEYHFPVAEIDRAAPRMKALAASHGLQTVSLTTYLRPDQSEAIRRTVAACQELGCPRFRVFSAGWDAAVGYPELLETTQRALAEVEEIVTGSGVRALIEVHFGTIAPSPCLALELVRPFDPHAIGVIFDPANLWLEGRLETSFALDLLGPYIDLVHVKNVLWERAAGGGWRWRMADLEEGMCDWKATIAALEAWGWDGWLSFENLNRVPVRHRGYVAEDLSDPSRPPRVIDERLPAELAYIKRLVHSG
jgi:sugar phosphate isomerase/epimerase